MKLWQWDDGRQGTGYKKFTLFYSRLLQCDAYILKIPKGVAIPKHTDPVQHAQHHRVNITLRGHIYMHTRGSVYRLGDWYSYFRPDNVLHWADAVKKDTYLFSFGWLK